ncbi:MAG: acetyl-CoA acetyltransferase, partial [Rhizobacter sp.]|nr:acetyl-CoA acetyltransferase [Rhizobacter sp.]
MSRDAHDNTPVIVGTGEITHRTKNPDEGLEPIALMQKALEAAQLDAGAVLLRDIDSLDIVCEYSWPYTDAPALLSQRLGIVPHHSYYGVAGGESPVRFIHEAALRIQRGECKVAAVVGAEARYSVDAARKIGATLPWTPFATEVKLVTGTDYLPGLAIAHGVMSPLTVYPLYENATQAAWGQTPREALDESAVLWSRYSQVAADNPHAWLANVFTPQEVATPSADNRMIAWPYTKHMVANPLVNMGAGVLLTSLGHARSIGVPEGRIVHIWGGAAAAEPRIYLDRDQFKRSHAQDLVLETVLAQSGGDASAFEMLELYSCFPVVPKMARRTLGLAPDAQMTSTGGLSFFGAPLNN